MSNASLGQSMKVSTFLTDKEKEEILIFFKRTKFQSHYNNPYWPEFVEPYKQPLFISLYENSELVSFAIVYTRMSLCILKFGPVVENPNAIDGIIVQIAKYLKEKKYGLLTIQFPFFSDLAVNTHLLDRMHREYKIESGEKGWSTIMIALRSKNIEEIFKAFSKGHKSSIKKAIKDGVEVRLIDNKDDLTKLANIYDDMHHRKGLIVPLPDSKSAFDKIFKSGLGVFAGVYKGADLLGGTVFVSEGNQFLYKFGATDVKYFDVSVLHLAIYEMIKYALETKHDVVDLCGYTPDTKEGSYAFGINRFKKGFGGEVVEYTPLVSVKLNNLRYYFIRCLIVISGIMPEKIKKIFY